MRYKGKNKRVRGREIENKSIFWLVKGKGIPYPEIINKTKRKLIKNKIKGYLNGSY